MASNNAVSATHIHLDVLGGIAGDMFIAAMLDGRPDLAEPCIEAIRRAGLPDSWRVEAEAATDAGMTGHRMRIGPTTAAAKPGDHSHSHSHHHYADIRRTLEGSDLQPRVLARALDLVHLIAATEARVHGVDVDSVALHEVGDLDSLADMVGAAFLIEAHAPCTWSVGPLPVGGGFIQAAHGRMPVPAPATQLLLDGFVFVDDGVSGERITPTGAAILRYLDPASGLPAGRWRAAGSGQGFGTRQLAGMANMLRVRFYENQLQPVASESQVVVLEFVIDDQTPEDLAIGLDALRKRGDVLEVLQIPAMAKKGRIGHVVQVMARAGAMEVVADACFRETTTLGLRWRHEERRVLDRQLITTDTGIGVKLARRPDGSHSAKAEADDIAKAASGHYERQQFRHAAETDATVDNADE
ncbi:MAG: LarC family nickel insertion protein [Rhodospirillales bacterium]|nr:LarC family nickel insertion protein [Rhodospirillales bacterium]